MRSRYYDRCIGLVIGIIVWCFVITGDIQQRHCFNMHDSAPSDHMMAVLDGINARMGPNTVLRTVLCDAQ